MSWEATLSPKAALFLSKMDKAEAERIIKKLRSSLSDPERFLKRLSNRDDLKMRAGNYRLLAKILYSQKQILILGIGHRKCIYKKK